jgi:hypothetical protein
MSFRRNRFNLILAAALALYMAAALPGLVLAQDTKEPPTSGQTPDPLGRLKQALSDAGATALTTSQESALTTLITDFRTANQPTTSPTRLAYDNYILSRIALLEALAEKRQRLVQMGGDQSPPVRLSGMDFKYVGDSSISQSPIQRLNAIIKMDHLDIPVIGSIIKIDLKPTEFPALCQE